MCEDDETSTRRFADGKSINSNCTDNLCSTTIEWQYEADTANLQSPKIASTTWLLMELVLREMSIRDNFGFRVSVCRFVLLSFDVVSVIHLNAENVNLFYAHLTFRSYRHRRAHHFPFGNLLFISMKTFRVCSKSNVLWMNVYEPK